MQCKFCNTIHNRKSEFCSRTCADKYRYYGNDRHNKTCPKCSAIHSKPGIFCSRSCANSKEKSGPEKTKFTFSKVHYRECLICSSAFFASKLGPNKINQKYCSCCRSSKDAPYKIYFANAHFKIDPYQYPSLFDQELIKKHGFFNRHKRNYNGLVLDHLYRRIDGWHNNVPAEIIAHPANARLIPMHENSRCAHQSSITLNELYQRIAVFVTPVIYGA